MSKLVDKMYYADIYHSGSGVAVWENDYLHKRLLENLNRFPGYKIMFEEEGWTFEDWLQDPPEFLDELKAGVKKGLIEFVNGTYTQPLIEVLGLESNIRQFVWGKRLAEKLLGMDIVTYVNQEHALHAAMPQILKLLGYKQVLLRTQLPYWGYTPQLDIECFLWRGIDGSEIPAVPVYKFQYYGCYGSPTKTPTGYGSSRCYISTWPPDFAKSEMTRRATRAGIHRPLFSRATDITRDRLLADAEIQRIVSDTSLDFTLLKDYFADASPKQLLALSQDLFDTVGFWGLYGDEMTRDYKKVERALLTAEQLSLISWNLAGRHLPSQWNGWVGGKHYLDELHVGWMKLFFSQQHDTEICSSSGIGGRTLLRRARVWTRQALCLAQEAIEEGLYQIGIRVEPPKETYGGRVVVYNLLSWCRTDVAEADVEFEEGDIRNLTVKDGGRAVPSHIVFLNRYSDGSVRNAKINFLAKDVPSLGYKLFDIIDSSEKPATQIAVSPSTVENSVLRIAYGAKGIQGIYLKDMGRELTEPNTACAHLRAYQGDRDRWVDTREFVDSVRITERTPLHAKVRVEGKTPAFSYYTDATIYSDIARIDFDTVLHFDEPTYLGRHPSDDVAAKQNRLHYLEEMYEENEKLRVFFPLNLKDGEVTRDVVYAASPTQRDWITAHNWVDISKEDIGAALVNTGNQRYVYERDGVLSMVLAYGGRFFTGSKLRDTLLEGTYTFRYSLVPHAKRDYSYISRRSQEINCPLVTYAITSPQKDPPVPLSDVSRQKKRGSLRSKRRMQLLQTTFSFLSLEGGNASVSALKWESGSVLLRLYEDSGRDGSVRLTLNLREGISRAWIVDLLGKTVEELPVNEGAVELSLRPWEIKTLRLEMLCRYAPIYANVGPHFDANDPYPSLKHSQQKLEKPESGMISISALDPR